MSDDYDGGGGDDGVDQGDDGARETATDWIHSGGSTHSLEYKVRMRSAGKQTVPLDGQSCSYEEGALALRVGILDAGTQKSSKGAQEAAGLRGPEKLHVSARRSCRHRRIIGERGDWVGRGPRTQLC